MTCINNKISYFKGDDLVDVITVNRPTGADDITITKAELQVGELPVFIEENPVFPYKVSIMREQSKLLNIENPIYLRITFTDSQGRAGIRRTCLGSLNLQVYNQVVKDSASGVSS